MALKRVWVKKNASWIILLAVVIGVGLYMFWPQSPTGTSSTSNNLFNVTTRDGASLEDVSDISQADIWTPKTGSEFETEDDYYDITLFELKYNNVVFENINYDLSSYEAFWVVLGVDTTPGYWTEDWKLVKPNGVNTDRTWTISHRASDVYCPTPIESDSGSDFDGTTDGNYSFHFSFPSYTTTGYHWNSAGEWDYDDAWVDLSAATITKLKNERYWREWEIVFDLDDDTANHDPSTVGTYKDVTNIGSIQFTFNDTVSDVNGNANQVNLTVSSLFDGADYVIDRSGVYMYINFLETWNCENTGAFTVPWEIQMGTDITCSAIKIGRLSVPGASLSGSTYTSTETVYS